jgi:hypothetical protein
MALCGETSEAEQGICLVNPALLELEEGSDIRNEFVVRAPENTSDQILVLGGQCEAEYRWQ